MRFLGKRTAIALLAGLLSLSGAVTAWAATRLDKVEDTYWDEEDPIARWEEVEDAYQYEIYLYRDESRVATAKTKKTYLNMEKRMTTAGDYTFKVRALGKGSSYVDGYWSDESDVFYVSESYAELLASGGKIDTENSGPGAKGTETKAGAESGVVYSAGWQQDAVGWWYRQSDGTYPVSQWWQDPATQKWYYFDERGYMMTGWIDTGDLHYYCDASGAMVTGAQTIDGVSYEFDASGALMEQK